MMPDLTVFAQQTLNFFDVARDGLRELYIWFLQFVRSGRIVWVVVVVVAAIIFYQRFLRK